MEVIDLINDMPEKQVANSPNGEIDRVNCRLGRKAANQISNDYPQYEWVVINSIVQAFCNENPNVTDKATVVQRCLERLDPSKHTPNQPPTSSQPQVKPEAVTITDSATSEDDFEEVCLLSKDTPLLEVLRLFPNAKKEAVNALLEKHAFEVHAVVQTMLDSGYEKEETEDSQDVHSESKITTVKHDFTSNAWETSLAYRKDAINELQRNFPFLTQPGLQAYFKKEKYHFYHTLVGIEKRLKVSGLYFSHSRVQHLAVAISGENTTTNTTNSTTNATSASPAAAKKEVKNEPDVIDLLDSQPQTFDFTCDTPSKPNTTTTTAASSSSSKKKPKSASARMLSACNSKYLTKEQISELRQRCDKNETGLAVKTAVLCTYKTSSATAEDSSLSYLMQPLDSVLQAEIDYLTEARLKELLLQDYQAAEALNEQIATDEGSLMECGCCYGECAFEALVQCSEGHLFCKQCLQRYCEQTVFGNGRSTLKCMCTAEVCEGFFSDSMLRHCLPEKVFEKFSQALSRDALTAAKMEGLVTCHHCSMQMLMEEDAGSVVHCPYCRHETCRLCNEKSHVPLRCSEVEKKSDTSARLSVEEAMTQARLRECLKCKTKFFKVEGCNKMTCRCGAIICYVCRQDISKTGYQHFCQTAHCNHKTCNKCKLFTNTLEDDRVAMKEAGLQQLLEEQQKLEKENEAKGGAKTATAGAAGAAAGAGVGVNKPGVVGLDLEKLLEGGALHPKAGPAGAVRGGAHAQALARAQQAQAQVHAAGRARVAAPIAAPAPGPVGGFGVGAQVMGYLHNAIGGLYGQYNQQQQQQLQHQRALLLHQQQQAAQAAMHAAQQAAQQARYAEEQRRYQAQLEAHRAAEAAVAQRAAARQQQQAEQAAARQHKAEQKAADKAAAEERRRQAQVTKAETKAAVAERAEEYARQQAAARAGEAERLMREARDAEIRALTLAQRNAQARKAEAEAAARLARAADEAAHAATRKRTAAIAQLDTAAAVPAVPVPVVQPLRQRAVAAPEPFPLRVAAAPGPPPPPPPLVGLQYTPAPPPPPPHRGFGMGLYSLPVPVKTETTVKTELVVKPENKRVKTERKW